MGLFTTIVPKGIKGKTMDCRICGEETVIGDIKHLNLFIIGSEGVDVCFNCEMKIVEFIQALKSVAGESYIRGRKHEKKSRKEI